MTIPKQRIRLIAGSPIVVGERRLLPSVLLSTLEGGSAGVSTFGGVRMRPVSIVEESAEGARWHAIPNATSDALNTMLVIGAAVAAVSVMLIMLVRFLRGR